MEQITNINIISLGFFTTLNLDNFQFWARKSRYLLLFWPAEPRLETAAGVCTDLFGFHIGRFEKLDMVRPTFFGFFIVN